MTVLSACESHPRSRSPFDAETSLSSACSLYQVPRQIRHYPSASSISSLKSLNPNKNTETLPDHLYHFHRATTPSISTGPLPLPRPHYHFHRDHHHHCVSAHASATEYLHIHIPPKGYQKQARTESNQHFPLLLHLPNLYKNSVF